jgi:hypothetical protein
MGDFPDSGREEKGSLARKRPLPSSLNRLPPFPGALNPGQEKRAIGFLGADAAGVFSLVNLERICYKDSYIL